MGYTYEIVPFGPDIEAAYSRLFDGEKDTEMLRWRYNDNPHGKGQFVVARDGDKVVGMIALIATRLSMEGQEYNAVQAVDTIVSPEARGKFLFVRMAQAIYKHADNLDAELIWGFPNAQAARGWFGRLEWTRFGMVPFVFRPLRSGYLLGRLTPSLGKINFPLFKSRHRNSGNIAPISRFGEECVALCRTFNAESGCALHYSPEFLNWRLIDCPNAKYRTYGEFDTDGQLQALVSGILLNKHDAQIYYLMEAVGDTDRSASLRNLLKHELAWAVSNGAEVALGWNFPGAPNSAVLRRAGFVPLPERIRPVEIHFGARPLREGAPEFMIDGSRWYLSYLNSDTV